jgi:SAM-dependent methyltransferase
VVDVMKLRELRARAGQRRRRSALGRDADVLFRYLYGRPPSPQETADWVQRASSGAMTPLQRLHELLVSPEYLRHCQASVLDIHLFLIHRARVQLVSTRLPPARRIVDLGGANGSVYDMGYPHVFEEIVVVDLPPPDRCEMYQHIELKNRLAGGGKISVLFTDMKDLGAIESGSVDLVYSGQSIEHISEADSFQVYAEVRRVLARGGRFCLDTPNRALTEIHVGGPGFIHPEHKLEYRPDHLRRNLAQAGFTIVEALGVCPMLNSTPSKRFDYGDFLNSGLSRDIDTAYIQYYECVVD